MPGPGDLVISPVSLDEVALLREMYRGEMGAQIVHDSWHARGFTDLYGVRDDSQLVGYVAVGGAPGELRDRVKEVFLLPGWRSRALDVFDCVVALSGARTVEAQTNDWLLSLLFFDRASEWRVTHVLFADAGPVRRPAPDGIALRPVREEDRATVFAHAHEPIGNWGLERAGVLVATGGVLFHYNPPYGDIFMEVSPDVRRRGYGSYLVQELARICRERGQIPAARCSPDNLASRRTLTRAGLCPCAHILRGTIST